MPEVLGTLRSPQLAAAPSSPARGELYYDTAADILYWWNGTTWVAAGSSGGTTPSGPAGGDLSGTYPNPQIAPGAVTLADLAADSVDASKIVAGAISDVEVSDTAAIKGRKINWSMGTSPPASPSAGDIWVYTGVPGSGAWQLVYAPALDGTYPWHFIGGPPSVAHNNGALGTAGSGNLANPTLTIPRAGVYVLDASAMSVVSVNLNTNVDWYIYIRAGAAGGATGPSAQALFQAPTTTRNNGWVMRVAPHQYAAAAGLVLYIYANVVGWDMTTYARSIMATPIKVA